MHIILKGTEKNLFESVLRVFLICRFLSFVAVFAKLSIVLMQFSVCVCVRVCVCVCVCVCVFVFTLVFLQKNKSISTVFSLLYLIQKVNLYRWTAARHKLTAFGTRTQSFDI